MLNKFRELISPRLTWIMHQLLVFLSRSEDVEGSNHTGLIADYVLTRQAGELLAS